MPSAIKELVVSELATRFRAMPHAFVVDFTGLKARQADAFRAMLRQRGARLVVVKNSLALRALQQLEVRDAEALFEGPAGFVYGGDDPSLLGKALLDWAKKEQAVKVRGGLLDGRALGLREVQTLASLPPVQVLRGQVVSALAAPLARFIGALQGIVRKFVAVVKAVAEKAPQS